MSGLLYRKVLSYQQGTAGSLLLKVKIRINFTASRRMHRVEVEIEVEVEVEVVKNSRSACGIAVKLVTTFLTLTDVQAENGLAERIPEPEASSPWTSCGAL
jgi:hypothetical protein